MSSIACPKCSSTNNPTLTYCWKCKARLDGVELSKNKDEVPFKFRKIAGYEAFDMCPFTMAQIGGGGGLGGVDVQSYTWTHSPCIREHCRLWTYKFDENKNLIAKGCSLQFLGLSNDEITQNAAYRKNFQ